MSLPSHKFLLKDFTSPQDLEGYISPVSPAEHIKYWQFMEDLFIKYTADVDSTPFRFFKTTYKINLLYFQCIYPFIIKSCYGKDFPGSEKLYWQDHSLRQIKRLKMFSEFGKPSLRTQLSYWKKNILRNADLLKLKTLKQRIILVGGTDNAIDLYIRDKFAGRMSILVPAYFMMDGIKNHVSMPEECSEYCGNYVDELNRYFALKFPTIDKSVFEQLSQGMDHFYNQVWQCYQKMQSHIKSSNLLKNAVVIVSPLGSMMNKIFCEAYREYGGCITGFSHGNPVCRPLRNGIVMNELVHTDKYVVNSSHEIQALKYVMFKNSMRQSGLNLDRLDLQVFSRTASKVDMGLTDFNFPVKTILIAGLPHSDFQHPDLFIGTGLKWLYLEISLLKRLRQHDFKIIYKVHPETKLKDFSIFGSYVDRLEHAPFESCLAMGDAIINMTFGSTTYTCSALSSKPFILIETPQIEWDPVMFERVISNIIYIRVEVNNHNMYEVNQNDVDQMCQKLKNEKLLKNLITERKKIFNEV